jgi:hypothetical protein
VGELLDRLTQEPIEFIGAGDDQVLVEFIQRGWTAGSDACSNAVRFRKGRGGYIPAEEMA